MSRAAAIVFDGDDVLVGGRLRIGRDHRDHGVVLDQRARDLYLIETRRPVGSRARSERPGNLGPEFMKIRVASIYRGEARVSKQVFAFERPTRSLPSDP